MKQEHLEIAVIDPSTLTCLGLKEILQRTVPKAVVRTFTDFGSFIDDTPDLYDYYFITSQTFILYTAFFHSRSRKVIILVEGIQGNSSHSPARILNVCQSEDRMKKELLHFLEGRPPHFAGPAENNILTPREIEVLQLVVKGHINKEIADKLHISLTTVISHRKNITEKLGIKSVSGLTIYAVMNGYVEADRI